MNTAGKIIGAPLPLPSLKDIYTTRLTRRATSIASDTSHTVCSASYPLEEDIGASVAAPPDSEIASYTKLSES